MRGYWRWNASANIRPALLIFFCCRDVVTAFFSTSFVDSVILSRVCFSRPFPPAAKFKPPAGFGLGPAGPGGTQPKRSPLTRCLSMKDLNDIRKPTRHITNSRLTAHITSLMKRRLTGLVCQHITTDTARPRLTWVSWCNCHYAGLLQPE